MGNKSNAMKIKSSSHDKAKTNLKNRKRRNTNSKVEEFKY